MFTRPTGPVLGCTENEDKRGQRDVGPQLLDKWVLEVEEVGAHCWGRSSWWVCVKEWSCVVGEGSKPLAG